MGQSYQRDQYFRYHDNITEKIAVIHTHRAHLFYTLKLLNKRSEDLSVPFTLFKWMNFRFFIHNFGMSFRSSKGVTEM